MAQYPVHWTAQSALHFLPSLTDLFIPTPFSASLGRILAMQQLRATTKSLTFPPLSIARYSFIQLSRQGRQWREGKCPIFQTVAKGDSNPGLLDCEFGILPLSYRVPERGHCFKLCQEDSKLNIRRQFFPVRTAKVWNKLPDSDVNSPNLNTFKNRLDRN